MSSDDEEVFMMSSEYLDDTKVLKNRQDSLKGDIEDLKSSVASLASTALKENCHVKIPDASYDEVKEVVELIVSEVAKGVEKVPKNTLPIKVPTLKSLSQKRLKQLLSCNPEYSSKLTFITAKIRKLENVWSQLDGKYDALNNRVDALEGYGRLYNLILDNLSNVPNCSGFAFSAYVTSLLNRLLGKHLYRPVLLSDIDKSHPLRRKPNGNYTIIVRFTCRDMRDNIYYNRHFLSESKEGSKVFILENLTKAKNSLFKAAQAKFGTKYVQTDQGKIFVTFNKSKRQVKSQSDVDKLAFDHRHRIVIASPTPAVETVHATDAPNPEARIDVFFSKTLPTLLSIIKSHEISSGRNCKNVANDIIEKRAKAQ